MTGEHKTILIVEDEALVCVMLEQTFRARGFESHSADAVSKAMSLIRKTAFAAAVLDIKLRHEDVYPVADELTKQGVHCVFTSAYDRDVVPAPLAHLPYFQKPYDVDAVVAAVAECVVAGD